MSQHAANRRRFEQTPFAKGLLARMMAKRGEETSRPSPFWEHWTDGIYEPLRREAESLVGRDGVRLHDYVGALNSSMVFAFNLFLPFRVFGTPPLDQRLEHILGSRVHVEQIHFEYVGDFNVLAETASDRPVGKEKFTASDVGIIVRRENGELGILLIEVKLSEGQFTHCNGRGSPYNCDRQVCEDGSVFFGNPSRCYLRRPRSASRDRRYWEIFSQAFGSVRHAFPSSQADGCPFSGNFQQIMRNHAMAVGLVQAGHFAFWHYGLIYHDENPDVLPHWKAYCAATVNSNALFSVPATQLLAPAESHCDWWEGWTTYMRARYFLPGD